jgi:hypothetical protein
MWGAWYVAWTCSLSDVWMEDSVALQSCHMGSLIDCLNFQPFICLVKKFNSPHYCYVWGLW